MYPKNKKKKLKKFLNSYCFLKNDDFLIQILWKVREMKVRVYYEDTDCGGIVYHTNYIKYCERARSEVFFSKGKMPYNQDCGFVVKNIKANFYKSAKLGDILEIKTQTLEIKKVTLTLFQEIFCEEEKIFDMEVRLGFVDAHLGKPKAITQEFMEVLNANN